MVEITQEMRDKTQQRRKELEEKVDNRIKRAIEYGHNNACFPIDRYDSDYHYIRAKYENMGYHIKPTGIIGGVWQDTEDICW